MSENTGNTEDARRAAFARLYGVASLAGGFVVIVLSWLVPGWVHDTVTKCNTVIGDMYSRTHATTGLQCTAANFVTDFRWIFVLLGIGLVITGAIALVFANDPKMREELDLD